MTKMTLIDTAVTFAVETANDNSHGYSQEVRWGPSYDCSSLVISAWDKAFTGAGLPEKSPKTLGATYTGNMLRFFKKAGFIEVPRPWTAATLRRGDVLLNEANHTAMMVSNTILVHARSGEGTHDTADNSGNEITIQNYYDANWDVVLRWPEDTASAEIPMNQPAKEPPKTDYISVELPVIRNGDMSEAVRSMQQLLIAKRYSCGIDGADGEYGPATFAALTRFQRDNGITADGVCGADTYKALFKEGGHG